jgi:hypothetical protein
MMSEYTFRGMTIPAHMIASLQRYIEKRIQPGGFLTAVLSNDLLGACERADDDNLRILPAYMGYLYNEAPGGCWGSPDTVKEWLAGPEETAEG